MKLVEDKEGSSSDKPQLEISSFGFNKRTNQALFISKEDISILEINLLTLFKLIINKVDTIEKIVNSTRTDLLKIKGFYKSSLAELEKALDKHNLFLKKE